MLFRNNKKQFIEIVLIDYKMKFRITHRLCLVVMLMTAVAGADDVLNNPFKPAIGVKKAI